MTSQDLFIRLLQSALWGSAPDVDASEVSSRELGEVLKLAKAQTVMGLIANEIMTRGEFATLLNPTSKERLTLMVQENYVTYLRLNAVLLSIVLELRKHGIDPVLLKGQGVSKYYLIPELRQCGDIDIYVGQEKFAKACEVIGAMSTPEDHQKDIPSLKHYHTRIGSAFIEIHRYTDVYWPRRYDRVYQKISDAGMHSDLVPLDFVDAEVSTPSVDFNVFFIFNHFCMTTAICMHMKYLHNAIFHLSSCTLLSLHFPAGPYLQIHHIVFCIPDIWNSIQQHSKPFLMLLKLYRLSSHHFPSR